MVRRKDSGGISPASMIGKDFCTSTYVSSPGCMRMTNAYYSPDYYPEKAQNQKPGTLHSVYHAINRFPSSVYVDIYQQELSSDYRQPSLVQSLYGDFSSYSHISFYAKAEEDASLDFYFVDDNKTTVRTTSEKIKSSWACFEVGFPEKYIDVSISYPPTMEELTNMWIIPRGAVLSDIWIDDIYFIDMKDETEKETWINMNITALSLERTTNVNTDATSGRYGDVVYSSNPDNRRGKITFRTFPTDDDEDVAFLESAQKNATELYLRLPDTGRYIKILNISHTTRDTWKGLTRDITFEFIEV